LIEQLEKREPLQYTPDTVDSTLNNYVSLENLKEKEDVESLEESSPKEQEAV
jgi:hypothetical protein